MSINTIQDLVASYIFLDTRNACFSIASAIPVLGNGIIYPKIVRNSQT